MKKETLSIGKIISVSLMLFAMFFGAGNMIFPPMLGHLGGENFLQGIIGFVVTDAGLSVLGIAAIIFVGSHIDDLGKLIGPKFAVFLSLLVYLLIGPFFALPRTGTVSYEMAVIPFLGDNAGLITSVIFTAVFFGLTYVLCMNPSRLVDIVGKILTPVLLLSIAVIFVMSVVNPVGEIGAAQGDYASIPFFKGMVEGYLALDGFAALAFAIVVINAIQNLGVKEPQNIAKYTLVSGVFAAIALAVVYLALGFVGAQTSASMSFENGGQLLTAVTYTLLGNGGRIVLGVAVLLACLTTSIGLASAFADYVHETFPKYSYKNVLTAVCLFSFLVSNVGLTLMITFTLPALVMVYPPVTTLVLLAFLHKKIGNHPAPYALAMTGAFLVGIFDGLKTAGISLGAAAQVVERIPFFHLGLGWIVPAIIGCVLGMIISKMKK